MAMCVLATKFNQVHHGGIYWKLLDFSVVAAASAHERDGATACSHPAIQSLFGVY